MNSPSANTVLSHCRECGAPLNSEAPEGFCPSCMLEGALRLGPIQGRPADSIARPAQDAQAVFGDYEVIEEIARGGMGVVYRARQRSLDRIVAFKMILTGQFASKHEVLRFRAEAEMAAKLHHPNIVAVHETGEHEGQPYFSMDFVQGRSLAEIVRESGPLAAQRAAGYAQTIAQAIHYAHEQGVLHRDLKPSNVLIDSEDRPRITDFGLAKRLRGDFGLTVTGQVLGSPNFMPPEQCGAGFQPAGSGGILPPEAPEAQHRAGMPGEPAGKDARPTKVGPTSDVYGIGAILYHLLTGRPPFQAATIHDVLVQLREIEPVPPRRLNPSVPRDVETICLKCLEKEPSRRYQTAQELAEELDRFLKDEPIRSRPVSRIERAWRWCRRKPLIASLALASIILLLAVTIGAPIAAFRINQERLLTRQSLYSSDMKLASQALKEGAFNHARELLAPYSRRHGADDLRGFEWRYLSQAVQGSEPFRTLDGLPAPGGWVETLLSRSERVLYNQSGGQLRAWDTTTWEPVPIIMPPQPASVDWQWNVSQAAGYAVDQTNHTLTVYALPKVEAGPTIRVLGPISMIAMSHDRQTLAVGSQDGPSRHVLVWDLARNTRIATLGNFEAVISALALSRDGTLLAASSTGGDLGLWDLKTLQPLPAPPAKASRLSRLEFTPDNKQLLSDDQGNLSVWDIGERQISTVERPGQVFGFSPDGKYLVVSWRGFALALLDARTLLTVGMMRGHRGVVVGIAFSPDGKLLASASVDQTARIWDVATQTEAGIVGGFGERISDVEFSADDQSIVLIGGFGQVRVHKRSAVLQRGLFPTISKQEAISRLALSPDERSLATISVGGTLALWDRQSRTLIRSVSFPRYKQQSYPNLAFSPDGQRVAWVTGDALRIMLVESGEISPTAIDGNHEVNSVAFSPNGRELAFGCGKQVLIHELVSGRQEPFAATDDEVFAVKYSPDGARIAFGDRQGMVTLCERASKRVFPKVKGHPPHVYDVEMSPDGRLLATCGADASIKLWRVHPDGLHLQATLRGHIGYVNSVAFSPDGTRLVSACGDQTLKIWDTHRAAELATLYGHHAYAVSVEFAKDGRTIYSSGFDGEIHFWEAPSLDRIAGESTPASSAGRTPGAHADQPTRKD